MGCNQSNPYPPPSTSSYEVEEIRYQITFLPNHKIIGEFGQKIITNPLNNSSSSSSDMYKKEMKHNVYIKSIHPSVLTYCVDDHGMKVGDVIEKIRTDGPDGFGHDIIELNETTNSLLKDERPIILTCSGKRYNKEDAMYWAWEKRKEYRKEFPGKTPLVCACEKGRLEDVKLLITGRNDVNGSNGNNNMTLKEYMNQVGKSSGVYLDCELTPLQIAAYKGHFQIVKYLIEQCEADPNNENSERRNALHYAAAGSWKHKNIGLIDFLLTHISLNSINKKDNWGSTPLDTVYRIRRCQIQQEIIALLRKHCGKANHHDANGRDVGSGKGDLNDLHNAVKS